MTTFIRWTKIAWCICETFFIFFNLVVEKTFGLDQSGSENQISELESVSRSKVTENFLNFAKILFKRQRRFIEYLILILQFSILF